MEYIEVFDEEEEYAVEAILDYKRTNGKDYFKVKWQGYDQPDWEEASNLTNCSELVNEFFRKKYQQNCVDEMTQTIDKTIITNPACQLKIPKAILHIDKDKNIAHVYFRDDEENCNYPLDILLNFYPDLVCNYYLKL